MLIRSDVPTPDESYMNTPTVSCSNSGIVSTCDSSICAAETMLTLAGTFESSLSVLAAVTVIGCSSRLLACFDSSSAVTTQAIVEKSATHFTICLIICIVFSFLYRLPTRGTVIRDNLRTAKKKAFTPVATRNKDQHNAKHSPSCEETAKQPMGKD